MTKHFKNMAAQGDFIIMRVAQLPAGLTPLPAENGKIVIAHSETGHNHVMEATRVKAYADPAQTKASRDLYELFLLVEAPTEIEHLRSYDTHEPIHVTEGLYKIRRQREYTPEGWRKAAD